jgi:hypothetical protein
MEKLINKLDRAINIFESELLSAKEYNVALKLLKEVKEELPDIHENCIQWCTSDFESRARETEEMEAKINQSEVIQRYDRSKFELALNNMVRKHDCNLGITWDTVDYYLDEYCLIK